MFCRAALMVTFSLCIAVKALTQPKPSVPLPPPTLHVVYHVTYTVAPQSVKVHSMPITAEYWVAAPKCARWSIHDQFLSAGVSFDENSWAAGAPSKPVIQSILTDGTTWVGFGSGAGVAGLSVYPINSWANYNSQRKAADVYAPGLLVDGVPFLGFQQPGKVYQSGKSRLVKTAHGWMERCRIPQGFLREGQTYDPSGDNDDYMNPGVSDKRAMLDARLTFDRQGYLIRFQWNVPSAGGGTYFKKYEYGNFVVLGNSKYVGRTIKFSDQFRQHPFEQAYRGNQVTYQVTSIDTKPMPHEFFTLQHPAQGTEIKDYRYPVGEKPALTYHYSGDLPLDQVSQRRYKSLWDKDPAASEPRRFFRNTVPGRS